MKEVPFERNCCAKLSGQEYDWNFALQLPRCVLTQLNKKQIRSTQYTTSTSSKAATTTSKRANVCNRRPTTGLACQAQLSQVSLGFSSIAGHPVLCKVKAARKVLHLGRFGSTAKHQLLETGFSIDKHTNCETHSWLKDKICQKSWTIMFTCLPSWLGLQYLFNIVGGQETKETKSTEHHEITVLV